MFIAVHGYATGYESGLHKVRYDEHNPGHTPLRPVSKAAVVVWGLEPRFRTPHDFGK